MDENNHHASQVVLVTGASSGIGKACCDRLSATGRRVYGASRSSCADVRWAYQKMDVTDTASVEAAVEAILGLEGRIDAVIHCAGVSLAGAVEDIAEDEARLQFDTNFFGAVRVIRSVLPVMRQQRAGKVIVIGSIAGLISLPFLGFYSASKFAIDGLVAALRAEVAPFGVQVTAVHPGDFNTALSKNRIFARQAGVNSPYHDVFRGAASFYQETERKAPPPDMVAQKIEELLVRRLMPPQLVIGSPLETLGVWGKAILPAASFEYLLRKLYGP